MTVQSLAVFLPMKRLEKWFCGLCICVRKYEENEDGTFGIFR